MIGPVGQSEADRRPDEYGEWTQGNMGQIGRTVTRWVWSNLADDWMPVVDWEPHPDEEFLGDG